jgi:hypothetical protein
MIFPRVHFKQHMTKDATAGTLDLVTLSKWMRSELFIKVMKHFIYHINSSKECPSLLPSDTNDNYLSIEVTDLARETGIIIVILHPHYTHKWQPLDVVVGKVFKIYYNVEAVSWMMQHLRQMSIYHIGGTVKAAHQMEVPISRKHIWILEIWNFFHFTDIF